MSYADRSDEELLALARDGVAPAFGVLLHRHGPEVLALAEADPDPAGATIATFVTAMRALPDAAPEDVRHWLLTLATEEIDGEVAVPDGTVATRTEDDATLDEVWAELAIRWPNGRVPRHLPSWVVWLVTTVLLVGLAIALPWAILGVADEEEIEELRASPVLEDLTLQEEPVEEVEEEPLPTFEFPEPPEEPAAPEPEPAPAPAPPPPPEPEPAPEPEPEPEPEAVEEQEPEEEPESEAAEEQEPEEEPAPEETDEGATADQGDDGE